MVFLKSWRAVIFSPSVTCFRRLSRVFAVVRRLSPSFAIFRRISTYFTIFHIYFGAWNCIALPKEQGPSHPLQPTHVHTHACTRSQGDVFNVLVQCADHLTQRNFQALSRLSLSLEFRGIQNARSTVHAQFARGPSTDMCSLCQSQRQAHTVFKIRLGGSAWQAIAL